MGTSIADGGISIGSFATDWTNDVLFGEIVPNALGGFLESVGVADWLYGLIMDGIVAGVGAVLGFVPQMLVLFFLPDRPNLRKIRSMMKATRAM